MVNVTPGTGKYVGNSDKDRAASAIPEKVVEKVVVSAVSERKKPLGRRFAAAFGGADAKSTGHYVVFNVILPHLKDLIFDVGESALRKTLFGDDSNRGYSPRTATVARGIYSNVSNGVISKAQAVGQSAPVIPSNQFGEYVVADRGDAETIMGKMADYIESYGVVTHADLKTMLGLTPNITDEKFGWTHMGGTDIRRVGGGNPGHLLIWPNPVELP